MNILRSLAYPLLAAPFVVDGIGAVVSPDPHADKLLEAWDGLERLGAPELDESTAVLAARIGGAAGALGGIYLVVGKHKHLAAAVLAAATVPLAILNGPLGTHGRLERRAARRRVVDFGALAGGLIFAALDRDGKPSLKWRRQYRRQEKELVAATKAAAKAAAK